MPVCPKFIFTVIGIILNGYGLVRGVNALIKTHQTYGDGSLFPTVTKIYHAFKKIAYRALFIFGKKRDQNISMGGSVAKVVVEGISAKGVARVGFPEGISDSESIARLVRAVTDIYEELDRDCKNLSEQQNEITNKLENLLQRVNEESKRLETLSRKAVTGGIPLQVKSLLLIGFGTILMAAPTLWELLVPLFYKMVNAILANMLL